MARRLVLAGIAAFCFVTFIALEISGQTSTASTVSQAAAGFRQSVGPALTRWEFSHYESSAYEMQWFKEAEEAQHDICSAVARPQHDKASQEIVKRVKSLVDIDRDIHFTTYDTILPITPHKADTYMSRMHYRRSQYDARTRSWRPTSGAGIQLIEPLWGMLRDPFDVWCNDEKLKMDGWQEDTFGQSKQHIMPQGHAPYWYDTEAEAGSESTDTALWRPYGIPPWHSQLSPDYDSTMGTTYTTPRNIHLDLGSSYFGGWSKHGNADASASGQWFYDTYHARGQRFHQFIAVEVEELNDTLAYQQVPTDLIGKYNLINIGLTMEAQDKLNTIDLIKRTVKPNDFFVFKLDIDSAPIEMPIIESLLADDPLQGGASALVDELMFEHHVDFAPMNQAWTSQGQVLPGTLPDSYAMFKALRQKGIRAHSWP